MARQKTAVVGVTGCIAAYKACEIVRELQKAGLRVKVVMTEHATEFVAPLTFEALTGESVGVGMFDVAHEDPIPHITLANEADLMIVAPATANVVAKLANGIADDLLTSAALAMHQPILIAPAANVHMYEDASMKSNLATLANRGVRIVEADEGYLACGDEGKGRLASVENIVAASLEIMEVDTSMAGQNVLITAGPTIEQIDPVRFITNPSSGKTGYALAEAARDRGASVVLVTGPTSLDAPDGIRVEHVSSAEEMLAACQQFFDDVDIAIFSAAVSDYRPEQRFTYKLKKGTDDEALASITLVPNPDIIATLAQQKDQQVIVGYAAETDNVLENAQKKLVSKGADFIVANKVGIGEGFATDDNQVWLVSDAGIDEVPLSSKAHIANVVLDKAFALVLEKQATKK